MNNQNPLNALTIKQLEQLKEKGIDQENIVYQAHVSGLNYEQQLMQDIPYTYLVVKNEDADGGCVVYGWSDRGWYTNPTLRWLVMHFIEKENKTKGQFWSLPDSEVPHKCDCEDCHGN